MEAAVAQLKFPLAVLDFEASSLEQDSYPVECGLAVVAAIDEPMRVWSTLIAPSGTWKMSGHWSAKSAKIHGITHEELTTGTSPMTVADELNARFPDIVWCDGGDYDQYWLDRLYSAANAAPSFELRDVIELFGADTGAYHRFRELLAQSKRLHRAGDDAEQICRTLLQSLCRLPV
jgi:DNA polymerase-3 subunit epsilon